MSNYRKISLNKILMEASKKSISITEKIIKQFRIVKIKIAVKSHYQ